MSPGGRIRAVRDRKFHMTGHVFSNSCRDLRLSLARMTTSSVADHWLESPLGAAVLALETRLLQDELADVVGFELLQIGRWGDPAQPLRGGAHAAPTVASRPTRRARAQSVPHYDALPIATSSVEAVLLPHTLEHAPRPHELLREVDRVLVGEGNLVICAFNPLGHLGRPAPLRFERPVPAARGAPDERTTARATGCSLLGFEVVVCAALPVRAALGAAHVRPARGQLARAPRTDASRRRWRAPTCSRRASACARSRRSGPAWTQRAGARRQRAGTHHETGRVSVEVDRLHGRRLQGQPGPGRLGCAARSRASTERELYGGEPLTTNNRMELTAAIEALAALKRRCRVQLYTDSQYVRQRHHRVAAAVEEARLEDGRHASRSRMPTSGCCSKQQIATPRGALALGQGPRRASGQRARGRAREPRHRRDGTVAAG